MDPLLLEEYILNQVYNEEFQSKIPYDFAKDIIKEKIKKFDNKRKNLTKLGLGVWWAYVEDCRSKCGRNHKLDENESTDQASHIPVKVQDPIDSPLHDPEDDPADSWYNQKHLADLH